MPHTGIGTDGTSLSLFVPHRLGSQLQKIASAFFLSLEEV